MEAGLYAACDAVWSGAPAAQQSEHEPWEPTAAAPKRSKCALSPSACPRFRERQKAGRRYALLNFTTTIRTPEPLISCAFMTKGHAGIALPTICTTRYSTSG